MYMYAAWRRNDDGVREVLLGRHDTTRCALTYYAASWARLRIRFEWQTGVVMCNRSGSGVIADLRLLRHGAEKVAGSLAS